MTIIYFECVYICITSDHEGQHTEGSPKVNGYYIPFSLKKTKLIISFYFFQLYEEALLQCTLKGNIQSIVCWVVLIAATNKIIMYNVIENTGSRRERKIMQTLHSYVVLWYFILSLIKLMTIIQTVTDNIFAW